MLLLRINYEKMLWLQRVFMWLPISLCTPCILVCFLKWFIQIHYLFNFSYSFSFLCGFFCFPNLCTLQHVVTETSLVSRHRVKWHQTASYIWPPRERTWNADVGPTAGLWLVCFPLSETVFGWVSQHCYLFNSRI